MSLTHVDWDEIHWERILEALSSRGIGQTKLNIWNEEITAGATSTKKFEVPSGMWDIARNFLASSSADYVVDLYIYYDKDTTASSDYENPIYDTYTKICEIDYNRPLTISLSEKPRQLYTTFRATNNDTNDCWVQVRLKSFYIPQNPKLWDAIRKLYADPILKSIEEVGNLRLV